MCKQGWKARKPTGIAKDHRYVKPGIKGRLQEEKRNIDFFESERDLMAYARRSGWLELPLCGAAMGSSSSQVPIGMKVAHTAGVRKPGEETPVVSASSRAHTATAPMMPVAPDKRSTSPVVQEGGVAADTSVDTHTTVGGGMLQSKNKTAWTCRMLWVL
ncbi:uncharacterized protein IUM83_10994 [Phytophthora cinnamomi]|uniref:uncharacterized protein n=1 Tax=Phytophthora cinnamomi TaxID=4785 RepID=UPI00355A654C|nr:hypothetical protein IUM83_10994 [Phytophthora cinnamomi]